MRFGGMIYAKGVREMSSNKKWILAFSVALVAILLVIGVQGRNEVSQSLPVTDEGTIHRESETPAVDETMSLEPDIAEATTADKSKSPDKKEDAKEADKKEEINDEKEKGTNVDRHLPDSTSKKTSADSEKNKADKAGKPSHIDLSKTDDKQVAQRNEKGATPQPGAPEPTGASVAATEEPQKKDCKLLITCSSVFDHMDRLNESTRKVIPKDGIFLQGIFEIKNTDTVFDFVKRVCKEKNILLDYVFTPIYSTYYIKGIGNLYELDCGEDSGWMYQVDGNIPGYGCSQYKLNGGEEITFYYTCER